MSFQQTGTLSMRHVREEDMDRLYQLFNNRETQHLWIPEQQKMSLSAFKTWLARRIAHRWDHVVVFEQPEQRELIGFGYCYHASEMNGTTCLCLYIDKPQMNSPLTLRAAYLYLIHLFDQCKYRKLYAEVFAYNTQCMQLLSRLPFEQEGCLKAYQWWQERYWDQYIFSATRQTLNQIQQTYQPLLKRPSWNIKIS